MMKNLLPADYVFSIAISQYGDHSHTYVAKLRLDYLDLFSQEWEPQRYHFLGVLVLFLNVFPEQPGHEPGTYKALLESKASTHSCVLAMCGLSART